MVVVPAATPVTTPVPPITVATDEVLLVQVPPALVLPRVVVKPAHTFMVPVMAAGNGLTVTAIVIWQPVVGNIYDIVAVPADIPVTIPLVKPITAAVVLLLVHVPPPASVNAVVRPTHTLFVPVIADGNGLTVTAVIDEQPVDNV